ncbi:MAG: 3-phosphoshikimate 1-carboxyvinyltransferase [Bacteroidales bacterium]|nr:3-phosphoshikimate 1-carboxyvinyltransferase [Bacteroidales bacterium]
MKYTIQAPTTINTYIKLPASKSISNRALILNALAYSINEPKNLSDCDDTKVMLNVFNSNSNKFDIGAAGTSMRFLTAFLSRIAGVWEITGSQRMKNRPIKVLVDALTSLGAKIEYLEKEGFPPLKITGKALKGGDLEISGSVSSQYISALLMIAPGMKDGLNLTLTGDIVSIPYIKMTLEMLKDFGVSHKWTNNTISIKPQEIKDISYTVENDWSAASYWYEIASLISGSEIELSGLKKNSLQGDSKVAEYFKSLGVETQWKNDSIVIRNNNSDIEYFETDLTNEPDIAQTLVVTCALKNIRFKFSGLQTLRIKETDRIAALKNELKKLGYLLKDTDNSIEWDGNKCPKESSPAIDTYEDHRMAMAFAPASIVFDNIIINEPMVVSKSYPEYWNDLKRVGFKVNEIAITHLKMRYPTEGI